MVVNPSLIISSLKLRIIAILIARIFFFSKSYLFKDNGKKTFSYEIEKGKLNKRKSARRVLYRRGPFAMMVLKTLTFLSLISLLTALKIRFQALERSTLSIDNQKPSLSSQKTTKTWHREVPSCQKAL